MFVGFLRRSASRLAIVLVGLAVFGLVGPLTSDASAQEAPLRMVFLKSDPDDGNQTYNKLRSVLEASDDIQLIPSDQLLAEARSQGLSLETFRSSEQRINAADQFMRAMKAAQVEAIIVYDIFGGGRTVQLVAIGPWGSELSDVREQVSRPVSDNEALALFKEAFSMLIPQVRAFRAEQQAQAEREEQLEQEDQSLEEELAAEREEKSLKDQVVEDQRAAYGNLTEGFAVRGGTILGYRSMDLSTDANFTLDHATPLVGIAGRVDAIFSVTSGERQAFGASLWGHFAPFLTTFNTGNASEIQEHPGQFVNFGVDGTYLRGLSSSLIFRGRLGLELTSLRIDPNEFYTGNRYVYLRGGAGLMYRIQDLIDINLDGLLLPVFSSELSGTDFGPGQFTLGFGVDSSLDFRFLDPFIISVHYGLRYIGASYPEPNVISQPASTVDLAHMANIFLGYRF
ncbi:MAG: hypothetical protein ACQEVA_05710 [Myxococcota bacterium]